MRQMQEKILDYRNVLGVYKEGDNARGIAGSIQINCANRKDCGKEKSRMAEITKNGKKEAQIVVRLPLGDRERLEAIAKVNDIKLGALVRYIITKFFEMLDKQATNGDVGQ